MKKCLLLVALWAAPALAAPADPWTACYQGQLAVLKRAVGKDPGLTRAHQKESGATLLQVAADNGQLELARYLLDHGARPDDRDAGGATALHKTGNPRGLTCARLLLERGADVNASDKQGRTPLFSSLGYPQVAQLYLKHGARVNVVDHEGMTPLIEAFHWGQLGSAKLLLAHKADPRARSKQGATALHWAVAGNGWGDDADPATQEALTNLALSQGLKVNVTDQTGRTPLHWFGLKLGRLRAAEILLSKGADIGAKDKRGKTPLALALHGDLPPGAATAVRAQHQPRPNQGMSAGDVIEQRRGGVVDFLRKHGAKS